MEKHEEKINRIYQDDVSYIVKRKEDGVILAVKGEELKKNFDLYTNEDMSTVSMFLIGAGSLLKPKD